VGQLDVLGDPWGILTIGNAKIFNPKKHIRLHTHRIADGELSTLPD
jgi:hypothetical protein